MQLNIQPIRFVVCSALLIVNRNGWGQTIVQIRWLLYRTPCNTGEGFQDFVGFMTGPLQFLYIDLNFNFSLLTGTLKDLNTFVQTTAGTSEGRRTKGRSLFLPLVLQSRGRDFFGQTSSPPPGLPTSTLRYTDTADGVWNTQPDPSPLVVISSRCIRQNVIMSSVDLSSGGEIRARGSVWNPDVFL